MRAFFFVLFQHTLAILFAKTGGNMKNIKVHRILKNFIRVLVMAGLSITMLTNSADAAEKILSIKAWQEQIATLELNGAYDKAAELYTRALEQYPTYTNFFVQRGEVYLHLGNTKKAAADFQRALLFDDKCGTAILGQATLHALVGDMQKAWVKFEEAKIFMEDSPAFYFRRGKYFYEGIADYPNAFIDLDKAISLANDNEKPLLYYEKLSTEYEYANRYDESYADEVLKDAEWFLNQKNMPNIVKAQIYFLRANVYLNVKKNYRQSFRETELALLLSGDNAELQAKIFQKQYEILHHLNLNDSEKLALSAANKRTGNLKSSEEYR